MMKYGDVTNGCSKIGPSNIAARRFRGVCEEYTPEFSSERAPTAEGTRGL